MKTTLSICIPTYNRAVFIGETLQSIITQATDDIEIVVSDNASTDNTEDIIRSYSAKFSKIIYIRQAENLGADSNFMNVVANASGEYCWLFGSDDVMREGALSDVLTALKAEPAVLLSNRMDCDFYLHPMQIRKWLADSPQQCSFDFSLDKDFIKYFESATSLGAAFSYLSSIVVRRSLWNAISMNSRFMGTAYSHVYKIMSILIRGEILLYHPEWTVYSRTGNDSFMEHGYVRRVLLDINGYTALANTLLEERTCARKSFLSVLQQEHPLLRLIRFVAAASDEGIWPDVRVRFLEAGFNQTVLNRAEHIATAWWFKPLFVRKALLVFRRALLVIIGYIRYRRPNVKQRFKQLSEMKNAER